MSCTLREQRHCYRERMQRRNTGTVNIGPGDRPNWPARPTRQKTLRRIRHRHFSRRINQQRTLTVYIGADPFRHNIPWCGLRSRLGVVHQHPSGTNSTRSIYLCLSDGGQVHTQPAELWQVHTHPVDLWQVHTHLVDLSTGSCHSSRLAAACPRAAAACVQPAAAWPCLSAAWGRDAAASLFPATVQVHAAAARLHLLLQPPSLLLLSLLLLALTTGSSGWFPGALDTAGPMQPFALPKPSG